MTPAAKVAERATVVTAGLTAEKPEAELVEAAANGEVGAFTELCRRYYSPMVAIAHAVLGDRHLAEDAAQEGLAKAARSLASLKRKERFGSWLATICRRVAIDMSRAGQRLRTTDDLGSVVGPAKEDELARAVREAIDKLPAGAKELVFLRYYDGLSYERMSVVLGISPQAINGRLRRAKRQVARHLRSEGYDEVGR